MNRVPKYFQVGVDVTLKIQVAKYAMDRSEAEDYFSEVTLKELLQLVKDDPEHIYDHEIEVTYVDEMF
jgi:hypothetical protein